MLNKYIIYERFEKWTKNGKEWTDWFMAPLCPFCIEENDAKALIKKCKENIKTIDKATKLKHEYEYRLVDIDTLPIPSPNYHHKGRPTKKEIEDKKEQMKNYWRNR